MDVPRAPLRSTAPVVGPPLGTNGTALSIRRAVKTYGPVLAVSDASLDVPVGQVVGLLGPNGAGNSTLMKIVLGIVRANSGTVHVLGREMSPEAIDVKSDIGYVPEAPLLYEFLIGAAYLDFVADMYGMDPRARRERIGQYLTALELAGHENSMISGYSQGMKQKVALISALVHRPRLLVLDEPLNGLDPRSARIVKDLLRSLARQEGVGVLFSTHVLEIAQAICDELVILHHGQVLATGSVADLRGRAGLPGSGLEEVFLSLTGTGDLGEIVQALAR